MPAVAVSGRARTVSSSLNRVERLVIELSGGRPRPRPTVTRRNAYGLLHVPYQRTSGNADL
jgi:hypothetical protein